MECDICRNFHSAHPSFLCPACARSALRPGRVAQARLSQEKESIQKKVESLLDSQSTSIDPRKQSDSDAKSKWKHEMNLANIAKAQERIDVILWKSQELKSRIEQYKEEIGKTKVEASKQKQSSAAASAQLARAAPAILDTQQKSVSRKTHRHENLARDITAARTFLCKEAAQLSGLQRYQRKNTEGVTQESFVLNGLPIVDLRDLNDMPPRQVNASLANVSRLLVQTCYYLGVRLPAELTLPRENYFHATIYSPYYSYLPRNNDTHIPGLTSSNSSSPTASRTIDPQSQSQSQSSAHKLRPLFLRKKLSVMMREAPQEHGYFVEGVSYLAWNIAWLCRLQGLAVANSDWEEICAMGRNLWLLFIDNTTLAQKQQQQDRELRAKTSRKTASGTPTTTPTRPSTDNPNSSTAPPTSLFGVRSHSTSNIEAYQIPNNPQSASSGGSALPVDITPKSWKFASPLRLIDKLRAHLVNDASGAEWEVLSSGELDGWFSAGTSKVDEEPVLVPSIYRQVGSGTTHSGTAQVRQALQQQRLQDGAASTSPSKRADIPRAIVSPSPNPKDAERVDAASGQEAAPQNDTTSRPKGTSGWTKLKSRSSSNAQVAEQPK